MSDTNYEALRSAFDTILVHIKAIDTRLSNTIEKTGPILENLNQRIDQLAPSDPAMFEAKVRETCENIVEDIVERQLNVYDPTDHRYFGESVRDVVDEMDKSVFITDDDIKESVEEVIRNLTFTVEVR